MPLLSLAWGIWGAGQMVLEILLGLAAGIQALIAIGTGVTVSIPSLRRKVWGPLGRAWSRHFDAIGHMAKVDQEVSQNSQALERMAQTFERYAEQNEQRHTRNEEAIRAVNVRVDVVQAYMAGKEGGPLPWAGPQ